MMALRAIIITLAYLQSPYCQGQIVSILSPEGIWCNQDTEYFDTSGYVETESCGSKNHNGYQPTDILLYQNLLIYKNCISIVSLFVLLLLYLKSLQCSKCDDKSHLKPDFSVTDSGGNALGCKCQSSYVIESTECSIDELRQAKCIDPLCTKKCSDLAQGVSSDGKKCLPCGIDSVYDPQTGDCACLNPRKTAATNTPILTKQLMEVYVNNSASKDCIPCSRGSAVISAFLYGEGEDNFQTAGMTYLADPNTCASCPDPHMFFDTDYNCICDSKMGYITVGEPSIGPQGCIKYMPSINSDYQSVSFNFVQDPKDNSHAVKVRVNSIVLSHYYLRAASECEYFSNNGFVACQTLANLCVMQLYDQETSACRQFFNIIMPQDRNPDYRKQVNWKYTLPWVAYGAAVNTNDILSDRGIQMKMSFTERAGYSQKLNFKLAKYALNGTFIGIEDLTSQFFFCSSFPFNSPSSVDDMKRWYSFGINHHFEVNCWLRNLATVQMYFYEIYIVDEGNESCKTRESDTGECLYPVPVLLTKIQEEGIDLDPMKTKAKDTLSRRFFLIDNQAGRTQNGLSVIRYAKMIILRTSLQSSSSRASLDGRVFPPRLIIKYAERGANDLDRVESLQFSIQYAMDTTYYWSVVFILTIFAALVSGMIWIGRLYKWYNRISQKARAMGGMLPQQLYYDDVFYGANNVLHILMLACHSYAWVFTLYVFLLSVYWYIFFKFQVVVFILMPVENTFSGDSDEYLFFAALFHACFWAQTVSVAYKIFRQGTADVYFVDWEKPKYHRKDEEVSAWRVIMIANRWNEMQSKRKTSIECSLLLMVFFLVGLNLDRMATTHPNIAENYSTTVSTQQERNIVLQFANTTCFWFLVCLAQWIWRFVFYERYISEPPSQYFVDLCTVAKISMFIFDGPYHGYYLHCRSPHEFADCSIFTLQEQLQQEEHGYSTGRGLDDMCVLPAGCQTFEMFPSPLFHETLSKVSTNAINLRINGILEFLITSSHLNDNTVLFGLYIISLAIFKMSASIFNHKNVLFTLRQTTGLVDRKSEMSNNSIGCNGTLPHNSRELRLAEVHRFLENFIDQSPPPEHDGYRWVIQSPAFVERLLYGVHLPSLSWQQEWQRQNQQADQRQRPQPQPTNNDRKCVFAPDTCTWLYDYSFLSTTFLGIELDLILHDILTFHVSGMIFKNTASSVLCTYLMHILRTVVRSQLGKYNVAKKTQVDKRFMM